jgi:hypothetical protein
MAGLGSQVTFACPMPTGANRQRFDLRRHNRYGLKVLTGAEPLIRWFPSGCPPALEQKPSHGALIARGYRSNRSINPGCTVHA